MGVSQNTQKWVLACFMFFNGYVTAGGIIYGWPGLKQILKDEAQYAAGCVDYDPNETCTSQDADFSLIYTLGVNISTIATILYGFSLDRFGVRNNALSGAFFMCFGFILLAVSTTHGDNPFNGFMPGFIFISLGGLGTYLPAFQFASLFSRPTRILAMQSSFFNMAALTFTLFKYLIEDKGVTREGGFLFYAGLIAFCALDMVCLYPHKPYKAGDKIHLPILGWLGIEPVPEENDAPKQIEAPAADEASVKAAPAVEGAPTVELKAVQQKAPRDLDVVPSDTKLDALDAPDMSPSASPIAAKLPVPDSPAGSFSVAVKEIDTPPVVNGQALPADSIELAELKAARLVRDLTPEEFSSLKNSRTVREEMFSMGTILVSLHFGIGLLCANMYNANIDTLLTNMGDDDQQFTNGFVYITSVTPMLVSTPFDLIQKRFRYAGTSCIATTCIIISLALLFVDNLYVQLVAFFIFGTGRAFLVTVCFSFVATECRGESYGRVIAFVTFICACIGLLQLAMQAAYTGVADNNFDGFSAGMMIAMAPLYYFSYWCFKNRT